jgi:hypothetical protein
LHRRTAVTLQGDTPIGRRPTALAAAAVIVLGAPLLLGAAAPAAIRALSPAPAIAALEAAADALPIAPRAPEERTLDASADANVHPPLTLVRPDPPVRAQPPGQSWTSVELPPDRAERYLPPPVLRPRDPGWVARRLEIPALGVNVAVAMAGSAADEDFPPYGGAYILRSTSEPGRGTNSYLFAHAMPDLFKPLWWASPGQQVIVTMSDGQQLGYRVTAIVRDIPCPDPSKPKPAGLPPVLANATHCDLSWTYPTPTERLTMQTSQGFNRNYGEMVVIAEPEW